MIPLIVKQTDAGSKRFLLGMNIAAKVADVASSRLHIGSKEVVVSLRVYIRALK
jgi:hypothetical protein